MIFHIRTSPGFLIHSAQAAQNATTPAAKREAALRAAEQRFAAQRREAAETPVAESGRGERPSAAAS